MGESICECICVYVVDRAVSGNKGMNSVQYYKSLIWKMYINIKVRGRRMAFQPPIFTHTNALYMRTPDFKTGPSDTE